MNKALILLSMIAIMGCASEGEPAAAEAPEATTGEEATAEAPEATEGEEAAPAEGGEAAEEAVATQPDGDKLTKHIAEHLKLPANKEQILAACAQTEEFTAGEKKWIADTLPEGDYTTPEQVSQALGL
jgi:hypothetical protein